jgi:hypothetical protein
MILLVALIIGTSHPLSAHKHHGIGIQQKSMDGCGFMWYDETISEWVCLDGNGGSGATAGYDCSQPNKPAYEKCVCDCDNKYSNKDPLSYEKLKACILECSKHDNT